MEHPPQDATALLQHFGKGDSAVDESLMALIYDELHALAQRHLRAESARGLFQTTALAHEAYLKLIDQDRTDWKNRAHFLSIAARLIRRILVDEARARKAAKRGGDWKRITLPTEGAPQSDNGVDLVALEDALSRLSQLDERQAQVVELRFFGGLSVEETAEVLKVSNRTIEVDWSMARAWLHRELL